MEIQIDYSDDDFRDILDRLDADLRPAVLQAAAGGAEGVPAPPQADVALRGVWRAAVDVPDSGISAGFR